MKTEKPFYLKTKFAYAVVMLLAALVLALIPVAFDLDITQTETLNEMVPLVIAMGFALISGHTFMDALSMAKGAQTPNITDAIEDVKDAIENP